MSDWYSRLKTPLLSVALALGVTVVLLLIVGAPPFDALRQIFDGSLGRASKIPDTLLAWVPLTLAAAGLIVTFQAGMWNLGVEGQIVMGAIGSAWVVREVSGPAWVVIPLAVVAGALFGVLWALIPGWLRTRFRVHEIFSGVALNFLAGSIAVFLIIGPWSRQGIASTSGTDPFDESYWFPTVGGDDYSWLAILVALVAVLGVAGLMAGTRYGLRLKAVGENSNSAFLMGIPTSAYLLSAFALCGALAGVAGTVQALAFHHKLVPSISGGYGFLAILVVLLAGFRAVWTAPIGLFFAAVLVGSTQLSLRLDIDSSLAGVSQGILVLSILLVGGWQARRSRVAGADTLMVAPKKGAADVEVLAGIVAAAAPLVYASIGETITEKSGVVNLSLDGSILLSAMTAFVAASTTGSVIVGFAAAMVVSAAVATLVAYSSINLRLNQIAVGFVLFLLTRQLALFLGNSYVGVSGPKVPALEIPLLSEIPFLGTVLFAHNLSVYGSFLLVIAAWWFIYRTRPGLSLQGIGERPEAAFARGVQVNRMRYVYTIVGGALVGAAGAAVSLDQIAGWRENLTTNLGWIALAFVIFGGWNPLRVALACYLYRGLLFVAGEFQVEFPDWIQVLTQLPFLLMILMITLINTEWFRSLGDRYPRWRNFLASAQPSGLGQVFVRE